MLGVVHSVKNRYPKNNILIIFSMMLVLSMTLQPAYAADPTDIVATDSETDGANGFDELSAAHGVDTFTIGASTYAIVASRDDNGVQIIELNTGTTTVANSDSSRGPDATPPILGQTISGTQIVTEGFSFNGMAVDAQRYHTEFPLITAQVGQLNTIATKIYENSGPNSIRFVEFALGAPSIGDWYGSEAFIEVWLEPGTTNLKEIKINDKLNLIEDESVHVTTDTVQCSESFTSQCLLLNLDYMYREAPLYNVVGVKPVDARGYAFQYFFNDGIEVVGDSMNPAAQTKITAGKGVYHPQQKGFLQLTQIDREQKLWEDQYGIHWSIDGNVIKQLTIPEYQRPIDNSIGEHLGMDRMHPLFEQYKYEQHLIAMEKLERLLGDAQINKPMPESLGTILFGPQDNSERRNTIEYQLILDAENQRMEDLKEKYYDYRDLGQNNFDVCYGSMSAFCLDEE